MLALFLLIILGFFLLLGLAVLLLGTNPDVQFAGGTVAVVAGIVLFFAVFLPTGLAWSDQVGDNNAISQYQTNQQVYTAQRDTIVGQVKGYLAVEYPALEKSIFHDIATKGGGLIKTQPSFLFTAYPQLQSSKTLLNLTDQIQHYNQLIFNQQLNITQKIKDMRTRSQNPWYFHWIYPDAPNVTLVPVPSG